MFGGTHSYHWSIQLTKSQEAYYANDLLVPNFLQTGHDIKFQPPCGWHRLLDLASKYTLQRRFYQYPAQPDLHGTALALGKWHSSYCGKLAQPFLNLQCMQNSQYKSSGTDCGCTEGWNQESKRVRRAEVLPGEWPNAEHFGEEEEKRVSMTSCTSLNIIDRQRLQYLQSLV